MFLFPFMFRLPIICMKLYMAMGEKMPLLLCFLPKILHSTEKPFLICLQNGYYLRAMQDICERMQKQWNIIEYNHPISYFLHQNVPLGAL